MIDAKEARELVEKSKMEYLNKINEEIEKRANFGHFDLYYEFPSGFGREAYDKIISVLEMLDYCVEERLGIYNGHLGLNITWEENE